MMVKIRHCFHVIDEIRVEDRQAPWKIRQQRAIVMRVAGSGLGSGR
jgi:hypothetical protein